MALIIVIVSWVVYTSLQTHQVVCVNYIQLFVHRSHFNKVVLKRKQCWAWHGHYYKCGLLLSSLFTAFLQGKNAVKELSRTPLLFLTHSRPLGPPAMTRKAPSMEP